MVELLAPFYNSPAAPVWSIVGDRVKWVGEEARPADVAYRKMTPVGYVQLCVLNDEEPRSPWAVDVPEHLLSRDQQSDIARDLHALCERIYGEGTIYLLVFAVLGPDGVIPPHRDLPHDVNKRAYSHRLHIPLSGAHDTEFTLGAETATFEVGGVYEIDNMNTHSVRHRGSGYRVSVVLDFCPAANIDRRNAPSPPKVKLVRT